MSAIPNFADMPLKSDGRNATYVDWLKAAGSGVDMLMWHTPEQIPVLAPLHCRII